MILASNKTFTKGDERNVAPFAGDLGMQDGRRRAVGRLLTVMERFRRVRHTMPVHLVEALLRVAHHEGKSVIQYAREAGVSQSVMSRHLLELGNQYVKGEPGLGLVEKRTSSHSLREFEVTLTKKGRDTVEEIVDLLQSQPQKQVNEQ